MLSLFFYPKIINSHKLIKIININLKLFQLTLTKVTLVYFALYYLFSK